MEKQKRKGGMLEHWGAAYMASKEAVASQMPGRENGPADAYRHLIWAGELTRRFGKGAAKAVLEAKEVYGNVLGGQSPEADAMDRHNNEIGMAIGENAETLDDVIRSARETMNAADRTGAGSNGGAVWLDESKWKKNPKIGNSEVEVPKKDINWPNTDWNKADSKWEWGYDYGGSEHKARPGTQSNTENRRRMNEKRSNPMRKDQNDQQSFSDQPRDGMATKEASLESILSAPPQQWTKKAKDKVQTAVLEMPSSDPRRNKADALVRAWFSHFYGNQPLQYDPTGRMIQPRPIRPIPDGGRGGGEVHVGAYDRSQDGEAVHVRSHTRGRPS